MTEEIIQPFDSFSAVYKVLVCAGYYKLLNRPKNRCKRILHQLYRIIALMVAVGFNITHIIFLVQRRHNMDDVFDCSVIEIPQMNLVAKIITLNWHMSRVDKMNKLMNEPIFAAFSKKDEELLSKNKRDMHRLIRIMRYTIGLSAFMWPASHFGRRYHDPKAVVTTYTPFETDSWAGFSGSVILEVIPILWVGYGHLGLDCIVATYYAQAEVQLKIIKYNLEHLFDTGSSASASDRGYCIYSDTVDVDLRNRFIHYVKKYEAVAWFTNEIGIVFNSSMSFQFFTSTVTLCAVTHRMSSLPVTSVPFMFQAMLLIIMLTQIFLYCYFGNLVKYEGSYGVTLILSIFFDADERFRPFAISMVTGRLRFSLDNSESVITSVYLSDWLSASPKLRRLLLIAMLRWSRTLTPRVSGIVPLSLNTYVSILRSAYSLYAVLSTRK